MGAFCVSSLFILLYFGFGGFGIFLKTELAFWVSFIASILLAYVVIKLWKNKKGSFGATDAIFTFFVAFISFWIFAYIIVIISRL